MLQLVYCILVQRERDILLNQNMFKKIQFGTERNNIVLLFYTYF